MARRRQGLSQRRKAVGLTQESLAERLGVERSTVVRWEAGDTDPLPSIRPHVARALHVSIDQLAELLTESENADTTQDLVASTEVTSPVLPSKVQPEVRPDRAECEDMLHPQVAETVEVLRRALRSAGVSPEELEAMLLVGKSDIDTASAHVEPATPVPTTVVATRFAGCDVPEPAQTEVSHRPAMTTVPWDVKPADVPRRRARSRRFTRFAAAGVLAFAGGAASVLFIASHGGPIPPAAAEAPATSVAAIPAPDPGNDNSPGKESSRTVHTAPAAAPNKPAGDPAVPGAAVVPAPHTTHITPVSQTTSRSKPPEAVTPPPQPRAPAASAEDYARSRKTEAYARSRKAKAYAQSRKAALSPRDQHRTRLRPESPPQP
jgi:transcriptional regulator with XRE-family HTH domain